MSERPSFSSLQGQDEFIARHIGPSPADVADMLKTLKLTSLDDLVKRTVPQSILANKPLDLPSAVSEVDMLKLARRYADENEVYKSFIGIGYYGTYTPQVILRNVLENPGWYTAYTPYQAEIAQGRLEALLNFQTMIMDLTGMPIANSSLLDEGTAAAEAMHLCFENQRQKDARSLFVSEDMHPQTIEVLQTRAEPLGIEIQIGDHRKFAFAENVFAAIVQYPASGGRIFDYADFVKQAHEKNILVVVAADLLSLTLLKPPGEFDADIVVGSAQRFGVPMGYGGPHAAYMSTREEFKRSIPGRLVGVSIDAYGKPALRLALQTREQHIRREKATSNICTAQVLLAVMASMYAIYHGPEGLKRIALRTRRLACVFAAGLKRMGHFVIDEPFFDTLEITLGPATAQALRIAADQARVNFHWSDTHTVSISFDETTTREDVEMLWQIFSSLQGTGVAPSPRGQFTFDEIERETDDRLPENLQRKTAFLTETVFNRYHSETEMLRYLFRLQSKDLSLAHSMIPLGSCTMKLNATAEMIPVTWPEFAHIHPFAPLDQTKGYLKMIRELEGMLAEITGFAAVSLQPNAGSQGEYAGLLCIRKYHQSRGQEHRNICLIPSSAHGTNPASAVMAGMKVVVVKCDDGGNVDLKDLQAQAEKHADHLAALMVTYPSTHGVFEEGIKEICSIVHKNGGQVYMDGANMNALVGLCRPGQFGPDVSHLNLHKTFCIPHGGGGPGVGPIGVGEHLKKFLPTSRLVPEAGPQPGTSAVSSAPWGSAGILCISWAYIKMMGRDGLKRATEVAILNANYIAGRLAPHYPILYKGAQGMVAHECILDLRPLKAASGVEVEDVAKRLMDYGFHAPTMSWPVPGTLMVEPTESESRAELDRFCEAMIAIRHEIQAIADGKMSKEVNALKKAPHTVADVTQNEWDRPYSREMAAFPLAWVREHKFWPTVARINNAHGDRNLICSCAPLESYT
jgi:glycine dehydrogenase